MLIEAWSPMWGGGQAHVWYLCKKLIENHDCEIDLFVMNIKGYNGEKLEHHFGNKLRIFRVGKPVEFSFLARLKWCYDVIKVIKKLHRNS